MKRLLRSVRMLRHLPALVANPFLQYSLPGHFYSPIPSADATAIPGAFDSGSSLLADVDLNVEQQLALADHFRNVLKPCNWQDSAVKPYRYYFNNQFFRYADALTLSLFLAHFRPRRVIEVGSGFSSAAMLDVADAFKSRMEEAPHFTFIEPFPNRLYSLLSDEDRSRTTVIVDGVQKTGLSIFRELEANDILFVDSSHVSKRGSDVNHLLFNVLPTLAAGTIVHFHDIFWPFEYPVTWHEQGRAWNEAYILRAFLSGNQEWEILFFNSYLGALHPDRLTAISPLYQRDYGGSIWLRRVHG